jgi:putative alpha-1,2-mannosidase
VRRLVAVCALDSAWLTHSALRKGGTLRLQMGLQPRSWGNATRPPSVSDSPLEAFGCEP